jgi:hypothetical protein
VTEETRKRETYIYREEMIQKIDIKRGKRERERE